MNNRSAWIFNQKHDFYFLFFLPFLSLSLLFINEKSLLYYVAPLLLIINLLLSGGHGLGPILFFLFDKEENSRIKKIEPFVSQKLFLIFILPTILIALGVYLHNTNQNQMSTQLFLLVGLMYLLWNTYHFSKQQFGILAILKKKNIAYSKDQKNFDLWITHVLLSIIPLYSWFQAGIRFESLKMFNLFSRIDLNLVKSINIAISIFYVFFAVSLIYITFVKKKINPPIFYQYLSILIQSIGVFIHPIFYTIIIFGAIHRIQEIYFISKLKSANSTKSYTYYFFWLVAISVAIYLIFTSGDFKYFKFDGFGNFTGIETTRLEWYSVYALGNGILMSINFSHFYIDYYVYSNRKW